MLERIDRALKGIHYEIVEHADIVSTVQIHSESFHFKRLETFKENGLSLDNFLRTQEGDMLLIISKVIGFPEIYDSILHFAQVDFEQEEEDGYQTIDLLVSYGELNGEFELPNYSFIDFCFPDILDAMLQQILISQSESSLQQIEERFNPFTAKQQGLNPRSAQNYIKKLKRTAKSNHEQLNRLFGESIVESWLEDKESHMKFIDRIQKMKKS